MFRNHLLRQPVHIHLPPHNNVTKTPRDNPVSNVPFDKIVFIRNGISI